MSVLRYLYVWFSGIYTVTRIAPNSLLGSILTLPRRTAIPPNHRGQTFLPVTLPGG